MIRVKAKTPEIMALAAFGQAPGETELEEVRSDPRVVRLGGVLARADALLLTHLLMALER